LEDISWRRGASRPHRAEVEIVPPQLPVELFREHGIMGNVVIISATRTHIYGPENVSPVANRTSRHHRAGAAQVGPEIPVTRNCGGQFSFFQSPLLCGRVNLAEVVDAGVGLCGLTSSNEVGNRDSCQEADDGHDNHDFNQRKPTFAVVFHCLHLLFLSPNCGVNIAPGGL
jgi:hypothetical protein